MPVNNQHVMSVCEHQRQSTEDTGHPRLLFPAFYSLSHPVLLFTDVSGCSHRSKKFNVSNVITMLAEKS